MTADESATPLNPIYTGIKHDKDYYDSIESRENVSKFNRDMNKIIDRCWNCSRFGMSADQDRRTSTHCQKCKAAMLKGMELAKRNKK